MPEFLNVNYVFHKDFFIRVILSLHLLMHYQFYKGEF